MTFTSWIPDFVYIAEEDDYDFIDEYQNYGVTMANEVLASMTANAAIFKMMRGG